MSLRHELDLPRGRIDYAVELLYQDPDDLDAMAAHAALTLQTALEQLARRAP